VVFHAIGQLLCDLAAALCMFDPSTSSFDCRCATQSRRFILSYSASKFLLPLQACCSVLRWWAPAPLLLVLRAPRPPPLGRQVNVTMHSTAWQPTMHNLQQLVVVILSGSMRMLAVDIINA
jgi:hypothetical protein